MLLEYIILVICIAAACLALGYLMGRSVEQSVWVDGANEHEPCLIVDGMCYWSMSSYQESSAPAPLTMAQSVLADDVRGGS